MSGLMRDISPIARRFLFGCLLNSLGSGLTASILVVYLNQVHDISIAKASLVLSWMALWGIVASAPVGACVDRFGPRIVMIVGLSCAVFGALAWSQVHTFTQAIMAGTIVATANSATWPPQMTMMSRMVDQDLRQKFFGWQFMTLNLGLGLGGLISSTIVRVSDPGSFTRLYVLDSFSYLLYLLIILSLPSFKYTPEDKDSDENKGSYREVLKDKLFLRILILGTLFIFFGYGSLDAGLPSLVTLFGGLSVSHLGPIWAVNTGMVVVFQVIILNRIEGRSRSKALAVIGLIWSLNWSLIALGLFLSGSWTLLLVAVAVGIFAVGETIWSPVFPALQNELAPEHIRGRYAAVGSLMWVTASTLGPAYSGFMLGHDWPYLWLATLAVGPLLIGFAFLRLGRRLTSVQDGRKEFVSTSQEP